VIFDPKSVAIGVDPNGFALAVFHFDGWRISRTIG
jgi:hypothetical protein